MEQRDVSFISRSHDCFTAAYKSNTVRRYSLIPEWTSFTNQFITPLPTAMKKHPFINQSIPNPGYWQLKSTDHSYALDIVSHRAISLPLPERLIAEWIDGRFRSNQLIHDGENHNQRSSSTLLLLMLSFRSHFFYNKHPLFIVIELKCTKIYIKHIRRPVFTVWCHRTLG